MILSEQGTPRQIEVLKALNNFMTVLNPEIELTLELAQSIIYGIERNEQNRLAIIERQKEALIANKEAETKEATIAAKKEAVIVELKKTALSDHQIKFLSDYHLKTTLKATKAAITKDLNQSTEWFNEVHQHDTNGREWLHGEKTVFKLRNAKNDLRIITAIQDRIKQPKQDLSEAKVELVETPFKAENLEFTPEQKIAYYETKIGNNESFIEQLESQWVTAKSNDQPNLMRSIDAEISRLNSYVSKLEKEKSKVQLLNN